MHPPAVPEPHLAAWRSVLNVHAALTERADRALRAEGLPPLAWYDVLWALRRAPGRRRRMAELARDVTLTRGGLTKLVDRLEAAGLLRREPVPVDRRGREAVLTAAGAALLRRMWPVYAGVLRDALVPALGEDEAAAVADVLGRVSAAGERAPAARD